MIDWEKETLNWTKEVPFTKENVQNFTKTGVYRLINKANEIVYIGSAYTKPLKERLSNYFKHNISVCSLRKGLFENGRSHEEIDEYFGSLRVSICEYNDLEVHLIQKHKPTHNKISIK